MIGNQAFNGYNYNIFIYTALDALWRAISRQYSRITDDQKRLNLALYSLNIHWRDLQDANLHLGTSANRLLKVAILPWEYLCRHDHCMNWKSTFVAHPVASHHGRDKINAFKQFNLYLVNETYANSKVDGNTKVSHKQWLKDTCIQL